MDFSKPNNEVGIESWIGISDTGNPSVIDGK